MYTKGLIIKVNTRRKAFPQRSSARGLGGTRIRTSTTHEYSLYHHPPMHSHPFTEHSQKPKKQKAEFESESEAEAEARKKKQEIRM